MTPEEAALLYSSLGWYVVPVQGKRPIGDEWQKHATNDQVQASKLFATTQHDGVGVQLFQSGLVDFDCDSEEAEQTLQRLFNGNIPKTPTFQSSKGKHRLFKKATLPGADKIRIIIDGLEIRTGSGEKGAQTVFPPSGGRAWIVEPETPLEEIPDFVLAAIEKRYAETHKRKELKAASEFEPTPFYGDDETLDVPRWLAKHGREIIGRTEDNDVTRWHIICPGIESHSTANSYRDCCITQTSTGQLGGCCFHSSCGMKSWADLRDAIGPLEFSDYHEPIEPVDLSGFMQEKAPELPFPNECLRVPGFLGEVISYNLRTALYPQPELAFAAAICLLAVLTGRKVTDRFNTRTNIYAVGIAPSGAGKEHARKINREVLIRAAAEAMVGSERIASSAAIVSVLSQSPATLFQLDEIGRLLATMQNASKSPHLYNISTVLMQLYTSSDQLWKGDAYADLKKIKVINQPHAVVYGTSTPETFWSGLTTENICDGLLSRFMVFPSPGYVAPNENDTEPLPTGLVASAKAWVDLKGSGNLSSENPEVINFVHTEEALVRAKSHMAAIAHRRTHEKPGIAAVWSRSSEKTNKLALLFACSRWAIGSPPEITLADVNLAIMTSNWLTRKMLSQAGEHVAENDHERAIKRILKILEQPHTASELSRRTQWLKKRDRDEIMQFLIQTEQVGRTQDSATTKPITRYVKIDGGKFNTST